MSIIARHIHKSFGRFKALDDVDLCVNPGELVALLGPSGSGKTTLLRLLAGLEFAEQGRVELFGQDATSLHVSQRDVGFVFQHFALFAHMNVFENIAFGLRVLPRSRRPEPSRIAEKVEALLRLVQLEPFARRFPAQLSGGQRQRVALARALATEPRYLLLDEPFGALDARVRLELRAWLRELHDQLQLTTLLVTHDQDEALDLADRVVLMDAGRVVQAGSPDELLEQPKTPFVFDFLGGGLCFDAILSQGHVHAGSWVFAAPETWHEEQPRTVRVGVREHDLELTPDERGVARLIALAPRGERVRLTLSFEDGRTLTPRLHRHDPRLASLWPGQRVSVVPRRAHLFKEGSSAHLSLDPLLTPQMTEASHGKRREIKNEINVL